MKIIDLDPEHEDIYCQCLEDWSDDIKEAGDHKWNWYAKAGKVVVTGLLNGWCPAMNLVFERAKCAAAEFGDRVEFREIRTADRNTFLEWGIADALFVNNKEIRNGPPPRYEKIRKKIEKQVKKL